MKLHQIEDRVWIALGLPAAASLLIWPLHAKNPDPNFDLSTLHTQSVITASAEWIPYVDEADIAEGSALDFSVICGRRAEAGAFGRVVARGAHFEFERLPGVPQRFHGVNVCMTANFLAPEDAERFADRLMRMGYNSLRLHHHDGGLVNGSKNSTTPNPEQFRRLDALVAACSKRGIYITTDLYVSRRVPWREIGVSPAGLELKKPKHTFKDLLLFHEPAVSNYLAFARAFLGHVNEFTGRRYADDPAIALLSIVNEGNPGHHGAGFFRAFPGGEDAWRKWLAARKAEMPSVFGDVPDSLPKNTWIRKSKHNAAFSLFLTDLLIKFDNRVKHFLREEMGCKALVTSLNGGVNALCYQLAREGYDYTDYHFYFDHPSFIKSRWHLPSRLQNTSPMDICDLGVKHTALYRMLDRPTVATEFNFAGPNSHRCEGALLCGALVSLQDWAGMWRFAWSHSADGILRPQEVSRMGSFDVCGDPLNRAAERAMICLFVRGDAKPLSRTLAWVLPPERFRKVSKFSPYKPPEWSGAAWWFRTGSCVAQSAPAGSDRSVTYDEAYKVKRSDLVPAGIAPGDGQVAIDENAKAFRVMTPCTCGGFAQSGRFDADAIHVDLGTTNGTVWASSLDGVPLRESKRILVTHLTDLQNTGIAYANKERTILLDWGKLPHLVRVARAKIELEVSEGDWSAYRLSAGGRRLGRVPCSRVDGRLVFTAAVDADPANATMCYEVVKEECR